jgi:3-phenylpropionate/cinnamic acid dioxygenase small subunit
MKSAKRAKRVSKSSAKGSAKAARPASPQDGELRSEVESLLYRQAELLDAKKWQDYIDLFTDDGIYWVPASPEQTTGEGVPTIFYEDRDLMTVRMKRILHPRAWSMKTAWGTSHLVGNIRIEKDGAKGDDIVVRSRFHLMEFRRDASRHFAGSYVHRLKRTKNGLKIRQQRVDLVNGQGPYDFVIQAWV